MLIMEQGSSVVRVWASPPFGREASTALLVTVSVLKTLYAHDLQIRLNSFVISDSHIFLQLLSTISSPYPVSRICSRSSGWDNRILAVTAAVRAMMCATFPYKPLRDV